MAKPNDTKTTAAPVETTAAKKARTPRVNERQAFRDGNRNRLIVRLQQVGKVFVVLAHHKIAGSTELKTGVITQHSTAGEAKAAFVALCESAVAAGWTVPSRIPASDFDALPKPAAAVAKAARTRKASAPAARMN